MWSPMDIVVYIFIEKYVILLTPRSFISFLQNYVCISALLSFSIITKGWL